MLKRLNFLDGSFYDVETPYCRGCFMEKNNNILPNYIEPIYDDGNVIVRQDAEWPIPAFYIISIHKHIGSFDKLDVMTRKKICTILYLVRKGIRENFGVERAQIYHEEKLNNPHFHIWVLPLWEKIMKKNKIQPKIYESNVKKYIDLFKFEITKDDILKYNIIMKKYIENNIDNL